MSKKTGLNYYVLLGISNNATDKEIKQAYWRKSSEHHPDKGGDERIFQRISEAYEVLSHPEKRKMYDRGEDPNDYKDNKDIAKERICTLVGNIIHHNSFMADYTDLVKRVREEINQITLDINNEISNNKLLLRRYDSILHRVDNADFIITFVAEAKSRVEEKISDLENDLEIQEIMHETIKESIYRFDVDDEEVSDGETDKVRQKEER